MSQPRNARAAIVEASLRCYRSARSARQHLLVISVLAAVALGGAASICAQCTIPPAPLPASCPIDTSAAFSKTFTDLTDPVTELRPGDRVRYSVAITNTSPFQLEGQFKDSLGPFLNADSMLDLLPFVCPPAGPRFPVGCPGAAPPACEIDACDTGGTFGRGYVHIKNLLVPGSSTVNIEFEVTVDAGLAGGETVCNQASYEFCPGSMGGDRCLRSFDPTAPGRAEGTCRDVVASAALTVVKTAVPAHDSTVTDGDPIDYTILVCNPNPTLASPILRLEDIIPAELIWNGNRCFSCPSCGGTLRDTSTCGVSMVDCAVGTGGCSATPTLGYEGFTLAANTDPTSSADNCASITFRTTLRSGLAGSTRFCNSACVLPDGSPDAVCSDRDPGTPPAPDPVCHITPPAPVGTSATKTVRDLDTPPDFLSGHRVEYRIRIQNDTALPFSGNLDDPIPAELRFDPTTDIVASGGGSTSRSTPALFAVDRVTVAASSFEELVFTALIRDCPPVAPSSPIVNQATLRITSPFTATLRTDGNPATPAVDTTDFSPMCPASAALTLAKTADLGTALPGDTIHWTVTISNPGMDEVTGVTLVDTPDDVNLPEITGLVCAGVPTAVDPGPTARCSGLSVAPSGGSSIVSYDTVVARPYDPGAPFSRQEVCNEVALGARTALHCVPTTPRYPPPCITKRRAGFEDTDGSMTLDAGENIFFEIQVCHPSAPGCGGLPSDGPDYIQAVEDRLRRPETTGRYAIVSRPPESTEVAIPGGVRIEGMRLASAECDTIRLRTTVAPGTPLGTDVCNAATTSYTDPLTGAAASLGSGDACFRVGMALALPRLLRNTEYPSLGRAMIFTGADPCGSPVIDPSVTLDPFGMDCVAVAGGGDDDDTYVESFSSGSSDPEAILGDDSRRMVFYQMDQDPAVGNTLVIVKDAVMDTLIISF